MLNFIAENFSLLNNKEKIKTRLIILINIFNLLLEIFAAALIYPLIKLIVNPETEIFTIIKALLKIFKFVGAYNQHLTIILLIVLLSSLKAIIFLINVFFQSRTIASINLRLSTELYEKYLNLDWVSISKKDIPSILRNINTECVSYSFKNLNAIIALLTDFCLIIGLIILLIVIEPIASLTAIIFLTIFAMSIFIKTRSTI